MRGGSINIPINAVHRLRVALLCSVATLLIPQAARARCVRVDLERDDARARVGFSRRTGDLAVRFSTTHCCQRLRAGNRVVTFVLTDVDRDGDLDLVTTSRRFGLQVWINKGRGLFFSSRSRQGRSRRLRPATHRLEHSVRGVESVGSDDSVLNDPRLSIVSSAPPRAHLVAACPVPAERCAALPNLAGRRPTPRGPPLYFS